MKAVKLGGNTDKFVPNGFTRVLFFLGFRLLKIFFSRGIAAGYRQNKRR